MASYSRFRGVGRSAIAAATVVAALAVLPADAGAGKPATASEFVQLGVHPWAAAQPTVMGKQLVELEVFDGKVWAGYGDYGANTGPIAIAPYDPGAGTFSLRLEADTEAVYNFREISGKLVAPSTDPRHSADFALGDPWSQHGPLNATHVFDSATLTGTDLWMVGSQGNDAVAWRSLDGGTTWQESTRATPTIGFSRFYFAAVVGGGLHVQEFNSHTGPASASRVFRGSGWTDGPSLLTNGGVGWAPVPFGEGVVYLNSGQGIGGSVYYFDGTTVTTIGSGFDIAVEGGEVLLLSYDGEILKSSDLRRWRTVARGPADARSIARDGSMLYVGTASSGLWSYELPLDRQERQPRCTTRLQKLGAC